MWGDTGVEGDTTDQYDAWSCIVVEFTWVPDDPNDIPMGGELSWSISGSVDVAISCPSSSLYEGEYVYCSADASMSGGGSCSSDTSGFAEDGEFGSCSSGNAYSDGEFYPSPDPPWEYQSYEGFNGSAGGDFSSYESYDDIAGGVTYFSLTFSADCSSMKARDGTSNGTSGASYSADISYSWYPE